MLVRLENFTKEGTTLYLDGKPASPLQVAGCCVNSGSLYMPDYILDESGKLLEVRYDKISHV